MEAKGTLVCAVYTENPETETANVVICIPGTKFGITRTVNGKTLEERSKAAGAMLGQLAGNFIHNNPFIANESATIKEIDGVYSYPRRAKE